MEDYCKNNNITLIHSSPYHPQTNGAVEAVHKEIRKYIYNEYLKNNKNFDIEDELFKIIKIHNNKVHTTTKRIPKEIRDINDANEIELIKKEIMNTLSRKNKNIVFDLSKCYVFDDETVIIHNNRLIKKNKRKYKKCKWRSNKVPIAILSYIDEEEEDILIEIKKSIGNFEKGEEYIIKNDLLEEVDERLWENLIS